MDEKYLLDIRGLQTCFYQENKVYYAVDDVSFHIRKGEILGVVGESGCGKSVTALSVLGLIPGKGKIKKGAIEFEGRDLTGISEEEMRKLRGREIAMIFQDPMISLSPVYSVGAQIQEAILAHNKMKSGEAWQKAVEMLGKVGIPSPERRAKEYPHQMSGGMRQRVMIAMALSMDPKLLIADELTTALDVTIQAQILDLIVQIRRERQMSVMLITHDLGVIAETADRVVVMYAGKVVESASVRTLFKNPSHPYTLGLMNALPRLDRERERLYTIKGTVPSPAALPQGCRYAGRCPICEERCHIEQPGLVKVGEEHETACFFSEKTEELRERLKEMDKHE